MFYCWVFICFQVGSVIAPEMEFTVSGIGQEY